MDEAELAGYEAYLEELDARGGDDEDMLPTRIAEYATQAERDDKTTRKATAAFALGLVTGAFTVADTALDDTSGKNRCFVVGDQLVAQVLSGLNLHVGRLASEAVAILNNDRDRNADKIKTLGQLTKVIEISIVGQGLAVTAGEAIYNAAKGNASGINMQTFVNAVADAIAKAFALADVPDGGSDQGDSGKWTGIGLQVAAAIKVTGRQQYDFNDVLGPQTLNAKQTASRVSNVIIDALSGVLGSINDDHKQALAEAANANTAILKTLVDETTAAKQAEIAANIGPDAIEDILGEVESDAERNAISDLIFASENEVDQDAQAAIAALDKLMAEIERTRAFWDNVNLAIKGGAAGIAKYLPCVGLVENARQFTRDLIVMYKRANELNDWLRNKSMALQSSSALLSATQNRAANATISVSEASLKAILSGIGLLGETLALIDPSGAGKGTSAAAKLGKSGVETLREAHNLKAIRDGWRAYKGARANPGNRKKARDALRKNATLAQCALGYGAVIEKDPIAMSIARDCGLTDEMLKPDAAVCKKVVAYFAMYIQGDLQVLLAYPDAQPWHPGPIALSYANWISMKAAANTKAQPTLRPEDAAAGAAALDVAFAELERALGRGGAAAYEAIVQNHDGPDVRNYAIAVEIALNALLAALNQYHPKYTTPDGGQAPHTGLVDMIDAYKQRAQNLQRLVQYDLAAHQPAAP